MTVIPIRPTIDPAYYEPTPTEPASTVVSADGVWGYVGWDTHENGTVVVVTHLLTGMQREFTTVQDAVDWAGQPDAVDQLAAYAVDQLRPRTFVLDEDWNQAVAALHLLGVLLPAGTPVDARCYCGGYLTQQGTGWVHVWTCEEEQHQPGACGDQHTHHHVCVLASPVECDHNQCHTPNDVNAIPCQTGRAACCGCCHGTG